MDRRTLLQSLAAAGLADRLPQRTGETSVTSGLTEESTR